MPSPFPGMDPYLEQPAFWSSFHSRLVVAVADAIEAMLDPQYYVEVETRTYYSDDDNSVLIGIPDAIVVSSPPNNPTVDTPTDGESAVAVQLRPQQVTVPVPLEVNERYLEIRELATGEVITAIEVLSPKNKRTGKGRIAYEEKRSAFLGSLTHLVELDLLRSGEAMAMKGSVPATAYRILISRSDRRPVADLYGFTIREPLPTFPVPLKRGEQELLLPLQEVFDGVYDRARYQSRINYLEPPPPPPLSEADQQWLDVLLASQRGG